MKNENEKLMQTGAGVITNWGCFGYLKSGLLKIGASFTNWGNFITIENRCYKWKQLLQICEEHS